MTKADREYIEQAIIRHSDKPAHVIRCRLRLDVRDNVSSAGIRDIMAEMDIGNEPQPAQESVKLSPVTGGISLQGKSLIAKKPTDVWGPRYSSLRKETGYYPETLADQWGVSVATVRRE